MSFFDELQKTISQIASGFSSGAQSLFSSMEKNREQTKKTLTNTKAKSVSPLASSAIGSQLANITSSISKNSPQFVTQETPIIKTGQKFASGVSKEIATPLTNEVQQAIKGGQDLAITTVGAPEKIIAGAYAGTLHPQQGEDIYSLLQRQPFLTDEPVQKKFVEQTGFDPNFSMGLGLVGGLLIPGLGGEVKDTKFLNELARLRNTEKIVRDLS